MRISSGVSILFSVFLMMIGLSVCHFSDQTRADSITGWRVLGPGGGGTMLRPTVSPHDPNVVLINCDMTGSYITQNGGQTWRIFNLRGRVDAVAFDPCDPAVIYAGNTGLYRSENLGMTWKLVWPDPRKVLGERMRGDHAGQSFITEDNFPGGSIKTIRIDPEDSNVIYVGFDGKPTVYFSENRGLSWHVLRSFPGRKIHRVFIDPTSPREDRTLYVFTDTSLFVRESGVWADSFDALPKRLVEHVAGGFRQEDGKPVFVIVTPVANRNGNILGGVFRSTDGGRTWIQSNNGFTRIIDEYGNLRMPRVRYVACSETAPDILYIKFGDEYPYGKAHVLPGRRSRSSQTWDRTSGIYKSTDGGARWSCLQSWSWDLESIEIDGGWINTRYGTEYMELGELGVAPTNPDICYSTDLYRAFKTVDGGRSWRPVYCITFEDGTVTTRGLDVTTCYGVHFDPFVEERVFITYTDIGLFRSNDAGESWRSVLEGVPHAWWNTCYWLEFDPEVRDKIWTVWGNAHDLPRHKMFRREKTDWWRGGVCVGTDGGRKWRNLEPGLPDDTAYTHIVLDPTSHTDSRTLYACGFRKGVYKSSDDGNTWQLRNRGLEKNLNVWRMARTKRGTLYLVIFRDYRGNREQAGALYCSRNGAESWTPVPLPRGVTGPADIAAHPERENLLYLAAWGTSGSARKSDGGVYRSEDGGQTWERILDKIQYVYSVTVDQRHPEWIYAVSFENAAYMSNDSGENWNRIRGFNFKWGHRAVPDPHDAHKIYVTTFGGSVWHGPRLGVPAAVIEDMIPWNE